METYSLNCNIYIVKGGKKHCIYDLNKGRLFSIDQEALDIIDKLTNSEEKELVMAEETLLRQLLKYDILTKECGNFNEVYNKELEISFIWIEVTQACNLRCVHCYNEADFQQQGTGKKNMSFSDFQKAIDEIQKTGVKRIQIIGGEPYILGDKLKDMLKYVKGKFEFIEIFTNGTLLKEDDFKLLVENNISKVALSVYSNIPSEHDKVTQVIGSHDKLMNTIKKLEEYNIPYRIANIRMKGIETGIEETGKEETGIIKEKTGYDFVRLSGRGNLQLYNKDLLREKLITKERYQKKLNPTIVMNNMKYNNCFSSKLYIDIDLNIYPCVMERRVKHGNIHKEGIKEILKEELIHLTKDKIDDCKYCEYRYACYDCRPDSLSGDFKGKPWYCTYNPYNGEWFNIDDFIMNMEVE
jgi:radical SAM protein with 4Fe4S-binding SPASM domain